MTTEEFDQLQNYTIYISPDWANNENMPPYYITGKIDLVLNRYNRKNNESFHEGYRPGLNQVKYSEMIDEELDSFELLRAKYCDIFDQMLIAKIGIEKSNLYHDFLIAYFTEQKNKSVYKRFECLVYKYLQSKTHHPYYSGSIFEKDDSVLEIGDISKILDLQYELINRIEEEYSYQNYDSLDKPKALKYFFRGLNLEKDIFYEKYEKKEFFYDKSIFSSYTNSLIIAELFSEQNRSDNTDHKKRVKAILACPFEQIDRRIFGNPIVNKELPLSQFDFIVIPSFIGYFINYKGVLDKKINYAIEKKYELFDGAFDTYLAYGDNIY